MDNRTELITEIISILSKIKNCEVNDPDENLFGNKYDYTSGEMLEACIEFRKRYDVNLNLFIGNISEFTVNNIADTLLKTC